MMNSHARWTKQTLWCVVASSLFGSAGIAHAQQQDTVEPANVLTKDHRVPHISTVPANAGEPVELFVRERFRADTLGKNPPKAVLIIHGVGTPVLPFAELHHKHYDWALELAKAGLNVFMLDFQGSGKSPRPKMDDPCNAPAAACTPSYPFKLINAGSDWDELNTVVDYIRATRGVEKVALVAWSHGAVRIGPYAVQYPGKVDSLLFFAPFFNNTAPAARLGAGDGFSPPFKPTGIPDGSVVACTADDRTKGLCPGISPSEVLVSGTPMTLTTRSNYMKAWDSQISCKNQVEEGIKDAVWKAIMDNDALGRDWSPEGVMRVRTFELWAWNNKTAGSINVPVLIIGGELDNQVPPAGFPQLYDAIPNSVPKLLFKVACAGHNMHWERQARVLHSISKQWLKDGAVEGETSGKFVVDAEGNLVD